MAEQITSAAQQPLRVLCLDGGGMRGVYTATYLSCVAEGFARKRKVPALDIGAAFDLIVGTSTGAILACALAIDVPPDRVVQLYRHHGPTIFSRKLPGSLGVNLVRGLRGRKEALRKGADALRSALHECFGNITLAEVYAGRSIALAIPAVELSQHHAWVFKTPHHPNTNHRDDKYRLVDVCMATTAAPLFRSLASIPHPTGIPGERIFADGGLWANNPVLVGLIDALEIANPGQSIEIFCLGTCPRPAGDDIKNVTLDRGLVEWRFGGEAAKLAIDAQEFAYDNMARMLARHVDRQCSIVRFPRQNVPAALMPYLDLDDTRTEALDALTNQARTDADMTNSACGDEHNPEGQLIKRLFLAMPERGAK